MGTSPGSAGELMKMVGAADWFDLAPGPIHLNNSAAPPTRAPLRVVISAPVGHFSVPCRHTISSLINAPNKI